MDNTALKLVRDYVIDRLDKSDKLPEFEVYTVWKCINRLQAQIQVLQGIAFIRQEIL